MEGGVLYPADPLVYLEPLLLSSSALEGLPPIADSSDAHHKRLLKFLVWLSIS